MLVLNFSSFLSLSRCNAHRFHNMSINNAWPFWEHGANPNAMNKSGNTALHCAAWSKSISMAAKLLANLPCSEWSSHHMLCMHLSPGSSAGSSALEATEPLGGALWLEGVRPWKRFEGYSPVAHSSPLSYHCFHEATLDSHATTVSFPLSGPPATTVVPQELWARIPPTSFVPCGIP